MKYYYSVYTGGCVCITAKDEFPLADLHKHLNDSSSEPEFIVWWREISQDQYLAFERYLKSEKTDTKTSASKFKVLKQPSSASKKIKH